MKPILHLFLLIGFFLHCMHAQPKGFKALFNGKDLDGWWGLGTVDPSTWINLPEEKLAKKRADSLANINKHWRVENGELVNDGHGLFLTTVENFSDFELLLDYKTVPLADSGIYLRGVPQVQIWDTTEAGGKWKHGSKKGSGGLWNNGKGVHGRDPLVHADKPFGEWNHFRVIMTGNIVTVWLNEKLVVDKAPLSKYWKRAKSLIDRGPIQLQTHGGEIRWKNIFIKPVTTKQSK